MVRRIEWVPYAEGSSPILDTQDSTILAYCLVDRWSDWPLPDPAKATGTEEEIMSVFRASRDDIKQRVADLLDRLQQEEDAKTGQYA